MLKNKTSSSVKNSSMRVKTENPIRMLSALLLGLIVLSVVILHDARVYILDSEANQMNFSGVSNSGGPCSYSIVDVALDRTVVAKGEEATVTVVLSNPATPRPVFEEVITQDENGSEAIAIGVRKVPATDCTATVSINAPEFVVISGNLERSIVLSPGIPATIAWILDPKSIGTHPFAIDSDMQVRLLAVAVMNNFGLTLQQSSSLSLFGKFFGPALFFPWIYELWKKRRRTDSGSPD